MGGEASPEPEQWSQFYLFLYLFKKIVGSRSPEEAKSSALIPSPPERRAAAIALVHAAQNFKKASGRYKNKNR